MPERFALLVYKHTNTNTHSNAFLQRSLVIVKRYNNRSFCQTVLPQFVTFFLIKIFTQGSLFALYRKVKLSLCLTKYHFKKTHLLLSWSPRCGDVLGSGYLTPHILNLCTRWWWTASANWIGVWMGPRRGLDPVARRKETLPFSPTGNRTPVVHPVV
jgi:hypothetical protein